MDNNTIRKRKKDKHFTESKMICSLGNHVGENCAFGKRSFQICKAKQPEYEKKPQNLALEEMRRCAM